VDPVNCHKKAYFPALDLVSLPKQNPASPVALVLRWQNSKPFKEVRNGCVGAFETGSPES
jgi:hypothetical protein